MATLDLYINLKPDSLTGAFVVSHKSGAAYKLPAFKRQEKVPIRLFFVSPNATGGYSNPFTIQDVSSFTPRVAIGTSHTPLAGPGSWTWDSGNLCYSGVLNLHTTEMENALNSAPSSGLTDQIFEVELSKSGQLFRAQQSVTVKKCVLDDMAGTPEDVSQSIFASMMLAQLKDSNSVEWRNNGSDIYADVRRKTGGGIYEDTDGLYVAPTVDYASTLFPPLSVEITGAGSPTYTATPSADTDSAVIPGVAGDLYAVHLQVDFSTEVKGYAGGTQQPGDSTYFCTGGTPGADDYNILSLTDGTTVWHLNRANAAGGITTATYEADIEVAAGATLTLELDSKDGKMIGSSQSATVTCLTVSRTRDLNGYANDIESRVATLETDDASTLTRLTALEAHKQYVLSASTTDTTPTEMLVGGATRLALPDFTSWAFEGIVMGRSRAGNGGTSFDSITGLNAGGYFYAGDSTGRIVYAGTSATSAKIYKSTDYGVTWSELTASSAGHWISLACSSDGVKVLAADSGGHLWTSSDSGANWTQRASASNWTSVASSADGTKLVAAEWGGYLWTSADSGATWTQRAVSRPWRAVVSSSAGTKLYASADSYNLVWVSTDSGATWASHAFGGDDPMGLACSADGTKVYATDTSYGIYRSTDSGATWSATSATAASIGITCSADGATVFANGQKSTDSGATWNALSSPGDGGYVSQLPSLICNADASRIVMANAFGGYRSGETIAEDANFIRGTARRGSGAASVVVTARGDEFGTADAIVAQADTTHGALQILVTGGNHPTTWKADIRTVEITL